MPRNSISPELSERFLRGRSSRAENADVVRALLMEPSPAGAGAFASPPPADEADLAAAFERGLGRVAGEEDRFEAQRARAAKVAGELERQLAERPLEELADVIRQQDRFHLWALSETLRLRSFDSGLEDPERAASLARLALWAAEQAADDGAVSRLDEDLLGAAWAQLGNALRITSDLQAAENAFTAAHEHLDRGTSDPLDRARLLSFEASLANDRGRYRDGIARCHKAVRLFRRAGDGHGQGRVLILEANLHVNAGDMATAIRCLDLAAARIDPAREPRLALVVLHNLASYLDQQDRHDEAWQRLEQARRHARRLGRRMDLLRLAWLEGRIAFHRGDTAHAEKCWNDTRAAFVELGVAYDAALVSLELAGLLARQSRREELHRLVEEMVPIFRSRSLHREVQTALLLFRDAVRDQAAGLVELARDVWHYLKTAENRPDAPFRTSFRR